MADLPSPSSACRHGRVRAAGREPGPGDLRPVPHRVLRAAAPAGRGLPRLPPPRPAPAAGLVLLRHLRQRRPAWLLQEVQPRRRRPRRPQLRRRLRPHRLHLRAIPQPARRGTCGSDGASGHSHRDRLRPRPPPEGGRSGPGRHPGGQARQAQHAAGSEDLHHHGSYPFGNAGKPVPVLPSGGQQLQQPVGDATRGGSTDLSVSFRNTWSSMTRPRVDRIPGNFTGHVGHFQRKKSRVKYLTH